VTRNRNTTRFKLGGRELLLVSVPARNEHWRTLTEAEGEIAEALLMGHTNARIAALRGTAELTDANQVAAMYRKLGVASRYELIALLAPPDPG
jgi:DNA-binding CsgD family transcriptional regulator